MKNICFVRATALQASGAGNPPLHIPDISNFLTRLPCSSIPLTPQPDGAPAADIPVYKVGLERGNICYSEIDSLRYFKCLLL
jgi:hypothetical protein